jgi:hypothetical protein
MVGADKPLDVDQIMAELRQKLRTQRDTSRKRTIATKVTKVFLRLVSLITSNQRS